MNLFSPPKYLLFCVLGLLLASCASPERTAEKERKEVEQYEREVKESGRISTEMKKDHRRPSKQNLSGNWTTGPDLVGKDIQLEQHGEQITGRGYDWGCLGMGAPLKISGIYHAEQLTLTVTASSGETYTWQMRFAEREKYPRLESTSRNGYPNFQTERESTERRAKVKK